MLLFPGFSPYQCYVQSRSHSLVHMALPVLCNFFMLEVEEIVQQLLLVFLPQPIQLAQDTLQYIFSLSSPQYHEVGTTEHNARKYNSHSIQTSLQVKLRDTSTKINLLFHILNDSLTTMPLLMDSLILKYITIGLVKLLSYTKKKKLLHRKPCL